MGQPNGCRGQAHRDKRVIEVYNVQHKIGFYFYFYEELVRRSPKMTTVRPQAGERENALSASKSTGNRFREVTRALVSVGSHCGLAFKLDQSSSYRMRSRAKNMWHYVNSHDSPFTKLKSTCRRLLPPNIDSPIYQLWLTQVKNMSSLVSIKLLTSGRLL